MFYNLLTVVRHFKHFKLKTSNKKTYDYLERQSSGKNAALFEFHVANGISRINRPKGVSM